MLKFSDMQLQFKFAKLLSKYGKIHFVSEKPGTYVMILIKM